MGSFGSAMTMFHSQRITSSALIRPEANRSFIADWTARFTLTFLYRREAAAQRDPGAQLYQVRRYAADWFRSLRYSYTKRCCMWFSQYSLGSWLSLARFISYFCISWVLNCVRGGTLIPAGFKCCCCVLFAYLLLRTQPSVLARFLMASSLRPYFLPKALWESWVVM